MKKNGSNKLADKKQAFSHGSTAPPSLTSSPPPSLPLVLFLPSNSLQNSPTCSIPTTTPHKSQNPKLPKASINGDQNNSPPPTKPNRRGRKKNPTTSSPPTKKTKQPPKSKIQNTAIEPIESTEPATIIEDEENYDDGIDFPYEDPPLVCCFGAARKEFVPTVRVSEEQMDADIYSEWKMLQWKPPEFARAPGGAPSNVAVAHVRLGGRAAFMGKVGDDEFGDEMEGKMRAETVEAAAEDSLLGSELNLAVLKEARMFHFNSEVLMSPCMHSTLFRAISWSKKFGGLIFFDLNLPLPLWKSRDETWEVIKKAWEQADIIEVTKQELEFLLDEDYYERRRNYRPQYYAENYEQTKNRRDYYHYTPKEISPLWHDRLKLLFVTDGTLRIHYYAPSFDGVVIGTEDVLITPFTCDRTGSGDAVVAGIMRKLTTQPEMYENQDFLERQLRFAIAAGIISQWTIGAVRGFPTESATQNLKEQVYVPSMW
ncbi:fructokinase-like 1 [Actinidia rufa]|uniref:Fructokinase-like 1 n=1 Tax=Actinidia rufa TaxID=165716 RepID=A0A7J0DX94_9ERIC|nr:fructokinase-like 1 [Actinidia rufa]